MKILFADANIFLRFLLGDIRSQAQQAKKYFKNAKSGKIKLVVCQIVIFEILFILEKLYAFSKQETVESIKTIVAMEYLEIEDKSVFLEALDLYERKNIDFVDTFLFCKAKNQGGEVLTRGVLSGTPLRCTHSTHRGKK